MPFDPLDPEPLPPRDPRREPRRLTRREEALFLALLAGLALAVVALPIGGGSVLDAVVYLWRR